MTTFCPHCHEEVSPGELMDGDEAWACSNCGAGNSDDDAVCSLCGVSREASDHYADVDLDGDDD